MNVSAKKVFVYMRRVKPKLILLQFCIAAFLLLSEKGSPTIVLKRVMPARRARR